MCNEDIKQVFDILNRMARERIEQEHLIYNTLISKSNLVIQTIGILLGIIASFNKCKIDCIRSILFILLVLAFASSLIIAVVAQLVCKHKIITSIKEAYNSLKSEEKCESNPYVNLIEEITNDLHEKNENLANCVKISQIIFICGIVLLTVYILLLK